MQETQEEEYWEPKTELGRKVQEREITSISEVIKSEEVIREPEIVDWLVPELDEEVILIGGTPGKGGGKRRIVSKRTARMHKSGRRFKTKAMVVVGNGNGLIGLAEGEGKDIQGAISKATEKAKMNIIKVRRGCGSWECGCKESHSLPFKSEGKSGSVTLELIPSPKGIGLCASEEVKKVLKLAGIKDVWVNTRGKTRTRENLIKATYNALKNLNKMKITDKQREKIGLAEGIK